MRLAAIYSIWDGEELFEKSINQLIDHVDLLVVVWQKVSNCGEQHDPRPNCGFDPEWGERLILIYFEPDLQFGPQSNEIAKRNRGIMVARAHGATHFLHMDCDEFYEDFGKAKQMYINSGASGSVCKMFTYFRHPTLRLENPDNYHVPFIHKMRDDTVAGLSDYPFYVDPTRKINETDVVELPVMMHHFSWCRLDPERKARNSTARRNIEKTTLVRDAMDKNIREGTYLPHDRQNLIRVPDLFGLSSIFGSEA